MSNDNDDLFRGFMERKTPYQLLSDDIDKFSDDMQKLREEVQEMRNLLYALIARVGEVEKQIETGE